MIRNTFKAWVIVGGLGLLVACSSEQTGNNPLPSQPPTMQGGPSNVNTSPTPTPQPSPSVAPQEARQVRLYDVYLTRVMELDPRIIDLIMEASGLTRNEARRIANHVYDEGGSIKIVSCIDKDALYGLRERFSNPQLGAVEPEDCDRNKPIGLSPERFDLAVSRIKEETKIPLVRLIVKLTNRSLQEVLNYVRSVNEQDPPVLFDCIDAATKDDLVAQITELGATVIVIPREDCAP